jgi:hypothetical protein
MMFNQFIFLFQLTTKIVFFWIEYKKYLQNLNGIGGILQLRNVIWSDIIGTYLKT